jgi:hypothetical protein
LDFLFDEGGGALANHIGQDFGQPRLGREELAADPVIAGLSLLEQPAIALGADRDPPGRARNWEQSAWIVVAGLADGPISLIAPGGHPFRGAVHIKV